MRRSLAVLLALALGLNGATMLAAGRWWYGAVPGVTATGPFNPHFVKDIGAAYLVAGGGFAWLAWKPAGAARGAAAAAAAFLALHAGVHLAEAARDPTGLTDVARDFPGVLAPALVAVWIAWTTHPRPETRHA
jgi:dipeptide/tripeptide permease